MQKKIQDGHLQKRTKTSYAQIHQKAPYRPKNPKKETNNKGQQKHDWTHSSEITTQVDHAWHG